MNVSRPSWDVHVLCASNMLQSALQQVAVQHLSSTGWSDTASVLESSSSSSSSPESRRDSLQVGTLALGQRWPPPPRLVPHISAESKYASLMSATVRKSFP